MPDFNIKDSLGNKVGSIEQKGPGVIETFLQMQALRGAIQAQEREEFVLSIYNLLDTISAQVRGMNSLSEHLDMHRELNQYISGTWLQWNERVENAPKSIGARKIKNYVTEELLPLANDIKTNVESLFPTLETFNKLNVLLSHIEEYFAFHNASCDRVEAQGLHEAEITDQVFLKVESTWGAALDDLINFHTEVVSIINDINNGANISDVYDRTNELFGRQPELQAKIENLVTLTNGREKAAERLLLQRGTSQQNTSLSDELTKLAALRESGVLSEQEFDQAKKKLLG